MAQKIRKRSSSTIPFGWEMHPDNDHLLVENPSEQATLEYVKHRASSLSLRDIVKVIHARHGRKITPSGVKGLLNRNY